MTGLYKVSSEVIRLWSWQKIKHGMYERAGVGTYIGLQDSVKLRFILGVKLGTVGGYYARIFGLVTLHMA